mgnify:FL=1
MSEHPSITFIPDGPGDEEGEGGQGTPVGDVAPSTILPPIQDGAMKMPPGGVNVMKTKLGRERPPKPNSEAALEEKMSTCFLLPRAKRTQAAVGPPAPLQAVRSPDPILNSQPSKEFDLRRSPNFPDHTIHW